MKIMDKIRRKLIDFLQVNNTSTISAIQINQKLSYEANAAKNKIWYRGNSDEIEEMYKQIEVSNSRFWKAIPTQNMEIHKIHTGLPKLIVKSLTNIVVNDYNGVKVSSTKDSTLQTLWDDISKVNKFDKLLSKSIKNMLVVGDGAFKITFDPKTDKEKPIIEYVSGDNIEFTRSRGRITEIIFYTKYIHNKKRYTLAETYGYGYITYKLYDSSGKDIANNSIPQTSWIKSDGEQFDSNVILATPIIYGNSEIYDGRGESIFDGKEDSFDALDEVWSQWMDTLRAIRPKTYTPECFIPRDPITLELIKPSSFDNRFISVGNDMSESGSGNKIYTEQFAMPHDSYLATYITALDLCLQGLISPSTLGIDTKKLDNAEAQREKEKTTLYTRGNIIELLNEVIPSLVKSVICGYQIWHGLSVNEPDVAISFGEYANPSFESQVETVAKGKTGGIMSIESCVNELYGDSKDEDWKSQEVARLKAEQGITKVENTGVNADGLELIENASENN